MENLLNLRIIISLSFLLSIDYVSSENILFLLPMATKSHVNVFEPLIDALAERNHNVTVVAPLKLKTPRDNVRLLIPVPFGDINAAFMRGNAFETRKEGKIGFLFNWNDTFVRVGCKKLYQNEEIKSLIKSGPGQFDLVVVNMFMNPCALGMVHIFQAPHIYLVTMPAMNFQVSKLGHYFPPSFVPSSFAAFSDKMTFKERVVNFLIEYFMMISSYWTWNESLSRTYQEHLGDHVPTIRNIDRNLSLILMNSHFSLTYPRPLLPDVVEIGGMSTRPAKPLSLDLEEFVSSAEEGFIYFSFGSIVQSKDMSPELRSKFLNVFSKLKQNVLWKWEGEETKDLPANVKVQQWCPQQDILGHPNIRLFITHGGLLSTQEAVYHGVPMIGFPFFADQDLNMIQAEKAGFAINLEITEMSEEVLENAINKILSEDSKMSNRAKELSSVFRDRLHTPVETAVYWVEYIIKHKGAPHLKSPARNLNFLSYHSIDVVIFLTCIVLGVLWLAKIIFVHIYAHLIKKKSSTDQKFKTH